MKKVLIALDYGPTAQTVAEAGFEFAKSLQAQVILIHVIADPMYYTSTEYSPIMGFGGYIDLGNFEPDLMEGIRTSSKGFLQKTKNHLGNENIETIVGEGDAAQTILNTAADFKADIIVLGTHSQKWLEAAVMGSVTEKILRHTAIPLFIIPTKKIS